MNGERKMILVALGVGLVLAAGCTQRREEVKRDPSGLENTPPEQEVDWSTVKDWECPPDTRGASMVLIPVEEGRPYCIDRRETTYGEYHEFYKAKSRDMSNQPKECDWNQDYAPKTTVVDRLCADCPDWECGPSLAEAHPDMAVRCLDFCDAYAYCAWAGKRLCGLRGAERGKVTLIDMGDGSYEEASRATTEALRPSRNEWTNVCTQGGTTRYPYGDSYEPGRCIDKERIEAEGDSARLVRDTSRNECHGTQPPYDQVYNMVGSVEQWINICATNSLTTSLSCAISFGCDIHERHSCEGNIGSTYMEGFFGGARCCADAVPSAGGAR